MNRENYHKVSFFEDICEVIIFFMFWETILVRETNTNLGQKKKKSSKYFVHSIKKSNGQNFWWKHSFSSSFQETLCAFNYKLNCPSCVSNSTHKLPFCLKLVLCSHLPEDTLL